MNSKKGSQVISPAPFYFSHIKKKKMPKIIPTRNFTLGLNKSKSKIEGIQKTKRKLVHDTALTGKEVEVPQKQADWFVKAGWAKFVAKDKKTPKEVKVTNDMLKGKEK
jgi:hypothetical protein